MQFSYRLFLLCTFFFSIAGGYYLAIIARERKKEIFITIMLISLITLQIQTQSYIVKEIFAKYKMYTKKSELMKVDIIFYNIAYPEYFPTKFNREKIEKKLMKIETESSSTKISNINRDSGFISMNIETKNETSVELPLTYYKGYSATLNGERISTYESNDGLVEVPINKSGKLTVEFTGTFLQKYSIYISLFSLIALIMYIVRVRKQNVLK